jgi:hypothetical protein
MFSLCNSSNIDLCCFGHVDLNVTTPKHFLDGEPIDEGALWFKVRIVVMHCAFYDERATSNFHTSASGLRFPQTDCEAPPTDRSSTCTPRSWLHQRFISLAFNLLTLTVACGLVGSLHARHKFKLVDLPLKFIETQLSLVCSELGSEKTLSLLGTSYGANFGILLNVMQLCSARRTSSPARSLAAFITNRVRHSEDHTGRLDSDWHLHLRITGESEVGNVMNRM